MRRQLLAGGVKREPGHLLLREHVPEAEFDAQPAVGLCLHVAGDQRLRVDRRANRRSAAPPAADCGVWMKARLVDRREQAGALEIAGDDFG